MSLSAELDSVYDNIKKSAPPAIFANVDSANRNFIKSFDATKAVQPGQTLPKFELPSATGELVSSDDLLASHVDGAAGSWAGGLLISFYRGGWCPFCNIELRSLQKHLPKFHAANITLVAISPELPDKSLPRRQNMGLEFLVLSDVNNELARKLGIVMAQPESLRPMLEGADSDWKNRDSLDVPVPATLLVDGTGVVREAFVNPDYQKRLEPSVALGWVEKMKKGEEEKKARVVAGSRGWSYKKSSVDEGS